MRCIFAEITPRAENGLKTWLAQPMGFTLLKRVLLFTDLT